LCLAAPPLYIEGRAPKQIIAGQIIVPARKDLTIVGGMQGGGHVTYGISRAIGPLE
jgi:hypothetical protein